MLVQKTALRLYFLPFSQRNILSFGGFFKVRMGERSVRIRGSNSRSEMGIAVVFGVLSATVFQIFIVPMLFVVIERIHGFKRPKKGIDRKSVV